MVQPVYQPRVTLTGRIRLRLGRFGRVIAQVEERIDRVHGWPDRTGHWVEEVISTRHEYRDATANDIVNSGPYTQAVKQQEGGA